MKPVEGSNRPHRLQCGGAASMGGRRADVACGNRRSAQRMHSQCFGHGCAPLGVRSPPQCACNHAAGVRSPARWLPPPRVPCGPACGHSSADSLCTTAVITQSGQRAARTCVSGRCGTRGRLDTAHSLAARLLIESDGSQPRHFGCQGAVPLLFLVSLSEHTCEGFPGLRTQLRRGDTVPRRGSAGAPFYP